MKNFSTALSTLTYPLRTPQGVRVGAYFIFRFNTDLDVDRDATSERAEEALEKAHALVLGAAFPGLRLGMDGRDAMVIENICTPIARSWEDLDAQYKTVRRSTVDRLTLVLAFAHADPEALEHARRGLEEDHFAVSLADASEWRLTLRDTNYSDAHWPGMAPTVRAAVESVSRVARGRPKSSPGA